MRNCSATLLALGLITAPCWGQSVAFVEDGYLGWSEIRFVVHPGWEVRIAESDNEIPHTIELLEVKHHGANIEIPASVVSEIKQPWLNGTKLLTRCCGNKVELEIPVVTEQPDSEQVWKIVIEDDHFASAKLTTTPLTENGF